MQPPWEIQTDAITSYHIRHYIKSCVSLENYGPALFFFIVAIFDLAVPAAASVASVAAAGAAAAVVAAAAAVAAAVGSVVAAAAAAAVAVAVAVAVAASFCWSSLGCFRHLDYDTIKGGCWYIDHNDL